MSGKPAAQLLIHHFSVIVAIVVTPAVAVAQQAGFDWRSDWAVEEDFVVRIDSKGYQFPTAIAFVPNPGPNAADPLYFITELRGKVKVVTNDRTVHTFAEKFFHLEPLKELPAGDGEVGLAGICLEPVHGYVFVNLCLPRRTWHSP